MSRGLARRPTSADNELAVSMPEEGVEVSDFATTLAKVTASEIEAQVRTAHLYPRSVDQFLKNTRSVACLDVDTAATCFYSKPQGGKHVTGPSIRLAEIASSFWGNIRTSANIIEDDGRKIRAQGVCIDIERNNAVSVTVSRRVTDKNGRRYSDDMVITTENAAISIALRNAIFRIIPQALILPIMKAAMRTVAGDEKSFAENRKTCLAYFQKDLKIKPERVFKAIGVMGPDDITMEHLAILRGLATSLKDNELTVDEAFPEWRPIDAATTARNKGAADLRERMAAEEKAFAPGVANPLPGTEADGPDMSPETDGSTA